MENLISRYRNLTILAILLFAQVLGLAVQVKRSSENTTTRLIRIWAVDAVTPFEKVIVWVQRSTRNLWQGYFYLRGVRQENRNLKQEIEQLKIERVSLSEDAQQAHRLQALLGFKEQYIAKTLAAQVIGSSGSERSRSIYIDKGSRDGVRPDQAVITADGVIGKVFRGVQDHVASVLLINDQTSGVGALLEKSRVHGVVRGTPTGEVVLEKVMTDETVEPGEKVLTSGGDRVFPKGLTIGTVTKVSSPELFLNIHIRPAANLNRLEEVLVITEEERREPAVASTEHLRAADILAQRLPSVPDQPAETNDPNAPPPPTNGLKITPSPNAPPPPTNGLKITPSPNAPPPPTNGLKIAPSPNASTSAPAAAPVVAKPAGETKPAASKPEPEVAKPQPAPESTPQ